MDDPLPKGLAEAWERFFSQEHTRPSGQLVYPEVFHSNLLFPLQRASELRWMMDKAGGSRTVMEIGADKGGGLYHWCKLPNVLRVVACEFRGTPYSTAFERAFPWIEFLWLPCSSYAAETVALVKGWLRGGKIDSLFVDGDKSHFDTDFWRYRPYLREGGQAFFHDVQDEAPGRAFRSVSATRAYSSEAFVSRDDWKEVKGEPANPHEGWLLHWKGRSCGVGRVVVP